MAIFISKSCHLLLEYDVAFLSWIILLHMGRFFVGMKWYCLAELPQFFKIAWNLLTNSFLCVHICLIFKPELVNFSMRWHLVITWFVAWISVIPKKSHLPQSLLSNSPSVAEYIRHYSSYCKFYSTFLNHHFLQILKVPNSSVISSCHTSHSVYL